MTAVSVSSRFLRSYLYRVRCTVFHFFFTDETWLAIVRRLPQQPLYNIYLLNFSSSGRRGVVPSFLGNLPRSLFVNVFGGDVRWVSRNGKRKSSFLTDACEPFEATLGHTSSYIFLREAIQWKRAGCQFMSYSSSVYTKIRRRVPVSILFFSFDIFL